MTPEQFSQLAKDLGVLAAFVVLLLIIVLFIVRSLIVDRRNANEFNKQMVQIIGDFSKTFGALSDRFVKLDELIDLQAQQITLLKDTVLKIDSDRKDAIAQNMQAIIATQNNVKATTDALLCFRDDTVKAFENAVNRMVKAREQTVQDINQHTDESQVKTGEAITAARDENRTTHAGQSEDLATKMGELNEKIDKNGDKTRDRIDEVIRKLEGVTQTLTEMRQMMTNSASAIETMAETVDGLVDTVNALKQNAPPPDPLAPVPPKNEDKEDKHA